MNKKPTKILTFMLIAFFLGGCSWFSPYKQGIQQGNILDEEAIEQLKIGMSQEQVVYLLGTPLLKSPNNPYQWDYIYQLRQGQKLIERETLRVNFETNAKGELRLSKFVHQP
ncbi:outer membrane protein assembly factor BamE [Marinospirillum minutulum]|uniref:outer membrane protein assembly factor BamE n=1 Tax=Marinospirillum minutulum TaxID=64974 RepID=UPI00042A8597|nr:outer membrane protein assembly factor BamE [Marinospirillum minutulum]